jgi:hypothetical protein
MVMVAGLCARAGTVCALTVHDPLPAASHGKSCFAQRWIDSSPERLENSYTMSELRDFVRLGVLFAERSVRSWMSRLGPVVRRVDEWTRKHARAVALRVAADGARAARSTAITFALVTAVLLSNVTRGLPKAVARRAAAIAEGAATLISAAVRAGVEFARLHRPRAPAVHTRASRSWWYGVEAVEGTGVVLRRMQRLVSTVFLQLTRGAAEGAGLRSRPDQAATLDQHGDLAAGEKR